jgi:putative transposase
MTVVGMCRSADVSRASFYRHRGTPEAEDRDMDLRDEIQKTAIEMPAYGRRRITAELKRRGWKANHKRVQRILREDNLVACRGRFVSMLRTRH